MLNEHTKEDIFLLIEACSSILAIGLARHVSADSDSTLCLVLCSCGPSAVGTGSSMTDAEGAGAAQVESNEEDTLEC